MKKLPKKRKKVIQGPGNRQITSGTHGPIQHDPAVSPKKKTAMKGAATAAQTALTIAGRLEASEIYMCEKLGLEDPELAMALINQVKQLEAAMSFGGGAEVLGIAMPMLFEMKPENLAQALLAVQMTGVHHAVLLYMKRAGLVAPTKLNSETPDTNMLTAMRLMRMFIEQLDAMAKLKGKAGQQKVLVEHVHIHHGGQAIVGTVTTAGRTGGAKQEGDSEENRAKTPGKAAGLVEKWKSTG